jgi:adenylate kinase
MSKHLVAYLTGPPASGKTSLARGLGEKGIAVFSYSQQLGLHIAAKRASSLTHEQLRERSASVVTREDVDEVDQQLVDFIRSERSTRPVIIDSHAVTREPYGFRVLPFATETRAGDRRRQ